MTAQTITLAHGEGARASRRLIAEQIATRFTSGAAQPLMDAACVELTSGRLAFTTDSFVVAPRKFPGGSIGTLAVYGTVNDLAVAGAVPRVLSLALIIEEGFAVAELERILDDIKEAAEDCHVRIVCGDTKVVPRGAADGIYINTSGIGDAGRFNLSPDRICAGDRLVVSGPIGRHGAAIMAARESLQFHPPPQSDCASLNAPISSVLEAAGAGVHSIRDATRGGVAAVLHEWAADSGHSMSLVDSAIPVTESVKGVSEVLGLDPIYLANEGTMLLAVAADFVEPVLEQLRSYAVTEQATVIGQVVARRIAPAFIETTVGTERPIDEPTGILLPRIC